REILLKQILSKVPMIIFACMILFPVMSQSQEWWFEPDSLRDDGPIIPLIINPLIDGIVPEKDYSDNFEEVEAGKEYNGFQVQVLSTKNGEQSENMRMELISQISHNVRVIFEAPNYKVRVGAFTNRNDAERLQKQLYTLGYRRAWIVRARLTFY
ncbi:MAG: SPOR domain-containing protein, partial [Candidatus Neomarinimicrobiota bacterium]